MSKFHFECVPSCSKAKQLIAKTDAKCWSFIFQSLFYCRNSFVCHFWISRTIGNNKTVKFQRICFDKWVKIPWRCYDFYSSFQKASLHISFFAAVYHKNSFYLG